EAELLTIIQTIDRSRLYLKMNYTSMFQYCVEDLKLSESRAYNFITVARKSSEVPELASAIETKKLSVSAARKICPVISKENHELWILKASQLSRRLLEREGAAVVPRTSIQEGASFVSSDIVEFRAALSSETLDLLKRAQDLVSQSRAAAASYDETLRSVLKLYIEKRDPVQKAERVLARRKLVLGEG